METGEIFINDLDYTGCTALHDSSIWGNFEICQLLTLHGADINVQSTSVGSTALMIAAFKNRLEIADLLMSLGADMNLRDRCGRTSLIRAIAAGHLDMIKQMLSKGADPNIRMNDSWTALMLAASKDNLEIVRLLIAWGADLNMRYSNLRGGSSTVLIWASDSANRFDLSQVLVSEGRADLNIRDSGGRTPLIKASINGDLKLVQLLVANDADPDIRDNWQNTALVEASRNSHLGIVNFFNKWPFFMAVIVLQELSVYQYLDFATIVELLEHLIF